LSNALPIENCQGVAVSPLLFSFALEYEIRKAQENQVGLELNALHHKVVCADDDNKLGKNINTIKKNTEALFYTSKKFGLELNSKKTKQVTTFMACH
jgi:hypothetical protein